MALPLPPGLVPPEVVFLCEMELVTVVPRQRLESIPLLTGSTPALRPPHRTDLPLWLAILLKKQRRANIVAPPWLDPASLKEIVNHETNIDPAAFSPPPPPVSRAHPSAHGRAHRPYNPSSFSSFDADDHDDDDGNNKTNTAAAPLLSPPFLPSATQASPPAYLPYHWLELSELLLAHAADDVPAAAEVRALLRDLQEVRAAKLRGGTASLEGGGGVVGLRGVGALELAESRAFVLGVVDGVRRLGASAEATRREEEEEGADASGGGGGRSGHGGSVGGGDSDDDMGF